MKRFLRCGVVAALCLIVFGHAIAGPVKADEPASAASATDANQLGWSAVQPDSGRYVKTNQGYMIPYTVTIPGTEASFTMQPIPGGKFKLGSPESEEERGEDESPQVEIEVAPFWMGQYEVTWSEYQSFMNLYNPLKSLQSFRNLWNDASSKADVLKKRDALRENASGSSELVKALETEIAAVDAITIPTPLYDPATTYESGQDPKQPAVTMSQYGAKQYTKWLSHVMGVDYRLPTEAEWEYACRAGTTTAFSYGEDAGELEDYGWFTDNSDGTTHLVGEKKPNPWGLYDIHGNVAEWVLDQYAEEGYDHLDAGQTHPAAEAVRWPTILFPRVLRGGHWDSEAAECRSAARIGAQDNELTESDPNFPKSPWWLADYPGGAIGFRIVRPTTPMKPELRKKAWEADVEILQEAIKMRIEEGRGIQENANPDLPKVLEQVEDVENRK
ncbi:MAG: formylglycine-generating enzyme family protein [Planctomycetales bacterium]|nr:formylglycine-generating enzyme family protein [Planctomycetales bacterium]